MMAKRSYTMRKRAESKDETRLKIVEATVQLHEELGPRATTVSAIAERAGVQRLTVYRHFPDETAVFGACSSHWLSCNPLPDPGQWQHEEDGHARLAQALTALYCYYRCTAGMWSVLLRDEPEVPALQGPMAQFHGYIGAIADDLVRALAPPAAIKPAVAATVAHALAFPTWQSLDASGLDDSAMVATVGRWVGGLLAG